MNSNKENLISNEGAEFVGHLDNCQICVNNSSWEEASLIQNCDANLNKGLFEDGGKTPMDTAYQSYEKMIFNENGFRMENNQLPLQNIKRDITIGDSIYCDVMTPKQIISLPPDTKPNSCPLIFYDLETSGLKVGVAEILQLSAVCGSNEFDMYIIPLYDIDPMASSVNGLCTRDGVLYYHSNPVKSVLLKEALTAFLKWLEEIPEPRLLIGQNIKRFDCPHILASLQECNLMTKFCDLVFGFIDTLPIFRELHPDMPNHQQDFLVKKILNKDYKAHNGIEDVKALQELVQFSNVIDSIYLKHSFTTQSRVDVFLYDIKKRKCMDSYFTMIHRKALSKDMAIELSKTGIGYQKLFQFFRRGGQEEVKKVLGEKIDGKVRVTENNNVIDKIVNYLKMKDV